MFKQINNFFNKLTILSKIIISIFVISFITILVYLILSIRYVSNNDALFNIKDKSFYKNPGFTFKSKINYKYVNFNNRELEYNLIFQDANLKTFETNIIIIYTLNENYIKENCIIYDDIEINTNSFNDHLLNLTTNYKIDDLIKDNKSLLKNNIKSFFNSNEYKMYDIKNILIISPIISK